VKTPKTLPPDVAKSFVEAMRAFFAEKDAIKRDAIRSPPIACAPRFPRAAGKAAPAVGRQSDV
jgi:hypothetical protein